MENQTEYLVDESRLCGRKVTIKRNGKESMYGTLHSLKQNGILVRDEYARYHFYPWRVVEEIIYSKESEENNPEQGLKDKVSEDTLRGLLIRKTIEDELDSDYRVNVTDEGFDIIYDDEPVIEIIDDVMHVSDEEFITLAKEILSKLNEYGIEEIERDYEE